MNVQGSSRQLRWQSLLIAGLLMFVLAWSTRAQEPSSGNIYRIEVLSGQSLQDAQKLKTALESLNYRPILLDRQGDSYRVLYGAFPSLGQAQRNFSRLKSEGITAQQIIQLDRVALPEVQGAGAGGYSVFVGEYNSQQGAEDMAQRLRTDPAGYGAVRVQKVGRFYRVYVGNNQMADAQLLFGQLREGGYTTEDVSKIVVAPEAMGAAVQQTGASTPEGEAPQANPAAQGVSPAIMQTEEWKKLTPDQQRQVIREAAMATAINSGGDPVAQSVIDLNQRLSSLDQKVSDLVKKIEDERSSEIKLAAQVNDVLKQGENEARSKNFQQAIVLYNRALDLDKDNTLGLHFSIQSRINAWKDLLNGEPYPGAKEERDKRIAALRAEAEQYSTEGGAEKLRLAVGDWQQIKAMAPESYGTQAQGAINSLTERIKRDEAQRTAAGQQEFARNQMLIYILGGAVIFLLLMVLLTWWRTRRQQKELMLRLHDITSASIRPMRGLEGTNTPLLDTGSGTESDLFSPRTPPPGGRAASDEALSDPLGGVAGSVDDIPERPAPKKPRKEKKAKAAPAPEPEPETKPASEDFGDFDALFGGSGGGSEKPAEPAKPGKPAEDSSDDLGFDALFGGGEATAEAPKPQQTSVQEAEPTRETPEEDIFGGLFSDMPEISSEPEPEKKPEAKNENGGEKESPHAVGPISFGDFGGVKFHDEPSEPQQEATAASDQNEDLLAIFDNIGGSVDEEQPSGNGSATAASNGGSDDETEIPSVRLDSDLPGVDTAVSMDMGEGAPDHESTRPAFAFGADDLGGGSAGLEEDFEEAAPGQQPGGWTGDYSFASLTVQGDTPPRGSQQYLCFEKRDGAGKALFSRTFPAVTGKVTIEFDLRCNDKNKFLLGIYFEKDGDFQQAVHTKILRSEAQTTPTIHMQGESAPYLLGSWAHIKYVVDLDQGKLDSYIDNTHVGRGVTMEPNPGMLNTVSIRDNINTTGVLLIDNIKVTPAA